MNGRSMRRFATIRMLASALVAVPAGAASGPWVETAQSAVRLVSRWSAAAPGGDAGLGLEFRLAPGWHVYWKNAGDAGYPPEVGLLAGPLDGVELLYPAPRRFDLPGGLVAFGYEEQVVYPLAARLAADAAGPARIALDLGYLVCAEQCIPYDARLELELQVAAAAALDGEAAALVDHWRERLPRPVTALAGGDVRAALRRAHGPELDLELAPVAEGLVARDPDLFFAPHALLSLERPVRRADGSFVVHLRPLDETKPLPERLAFGWTATGYELAGNPLALSGALDLERPPTAAALGGPVRWLLALGVVALVAFFLHRRSRDGSADVSTTST
jgi:DsbC/DsbD-like thiol-disulfide interchange protein